MNSIFHFKIGPALSQIIVPVWSALYPSTPMIIDFHFIFQFYWAEFYQVQENFLLALKVLDLQSIEDQWQTIYY